jgi:hypothetical protein
LHAQSSIAQRLNKTLYRRKVCHLGPGRSDLASQVRVGSSSDRDSVPSGQLASMLIIRGKRSSSIVPFYHIHLMDDLLKLGSGNTPRYSPRQRVWHEYQAALLVNPENGVFCTKVRRDPLLDE